MAEAMAIRYSLVECNSLQIDNIQIESDCKSLILKINSSLTMDSVLGTIIDDIRDLSKYFQSILFTYCSRKFNCAADRLAHLAISNGVNKV